MPEIRIDPLSGHRTIVAGERSRRPGGEPTCAAPDAIDVERDPFAAGHEDRTPPELYAVRPNGGDADTPGWTVRVVPNLYPALDPAGPPHHDGAGGAAGWAGGGGGGGVARANARTRFQRVSAADRQRAPRGRRVAAAHTRA